MVFALRTWSLHSVLLLTAQVKSEVEDLQPLVTSAEETLQHAKTHVEHMLNLNPIPNEHQLHPVFKNETEHLAYEMKKLSTKLHEVVRIIKQTPILMLGWAASGYLK